VHKRLEVKQYLAKANLWEVELRAGTPCHGSARVEGACGRLLVAKRAQMHVSPKLGNLGAPGTLALGADAPVGRFAAERVPLRYGGGGGGGGCLLI